MKKLLLSLAFLTSLINNSAFGQTNLSAGLTACYSLDGNANDPINTLTGTLSAVTSTVGRNGNLNSAYYFSGSSSSYINLPNSPLLKADTVSFSCWVNFSSLSTAQFIAFVYNGCTSYQEGYQLAVAIINGTPLFQIAKADSTCSYFGQYILNSNTVPITQRWYHVGFYAGSDSLKLYVDGALETVMASPVKMAYSPTTYVYLGNGGPTASVNLPMTGSIDNARFYNRKLTDAEMNQLYTQDPACAEGTPPVAAFTSSAKQICAGGSVTFTDLSTNNPTSFSWQAPGATPSSNTLTGNPTFTFMTQGTYTVSLVSSNAFGASNTATQQIVVSVCEGIFENNLGIGGLVIYPNPNQGSFALDLPVSASGDATLYNILGEAVLKISFEPGKSLQVDMSGQPNGAYFLQLKSKGEIWQQKIIKQ